MGFDDFNTNPMDTINAAKTAIPAKLSPAISSATSWAKNAGASLAASGSSLADSAAKTATGIGKAASGAFNDVKVLVTKQTTDNTKTLKESTKWKISNDDKTLADLFLIGRPCKFNTVIDPSQRFGNYLRSKMSVIDLIPVDYGIEYNKMLDVVTGAKAKDEEKIESIYKFSYNSTEEGKIGLYKRLCSYHGLKEFVGLRLFTTDDTTTNETIQVQYKDSTFQGLTDKMADFGQQYRETANIALGSGAKNFGDSVTSAASGAASDIVKTLGGGPQIQQLLQGVVQVAGDMVMQGNKMTFPKLWQNTSYTNSMSVNIRLVSPYGHPKAIKEFIMKPLSYLILLAAPQTKDGITFGGNIPITIKAYGMNYTIFGSIASLTFRRGGSDTSYNLYRQPLTIDVSIEFQTLFDAFAVFDGQGKKKLQTDKGAFTNTLLTDPSSSNLYDGSGQNKLMTSLGTILASLRPVRIVGMDIDPQVYGIFEAPDRSQIPNAPSFTPLTGNLGSTISGAVSSIGNFASMITNAPKLIQQGLSNAVYNTAKGSVSSIASTAGGWISKPAALADGIRKTLTGNLF